MSLLPVDEALARLLSNVTRLQGETVALTDAMERVLAEPLAARRTQPPFDASAMDGYAVRAADLDPNGDPLRLIGEAAAGHPFENSIDRGNCIRIFTGAPMPIGADTVLMQENAERLGDDRVRPTQTESKGRHVRPAGIDFTEGDALLEPGTVLDFAAISLAAAASHSTVQVVRRPRVAILATGDELKPPGADLKPGQIIASNSYGAAAMILEMGGVPVDFGIVSDDPEALRQAIANATNADVDVIVTLGGASVGDHDLVQKAMIDAGMRLDFWKIAMRPGKPLMVGRLKNIHVLGLPGNPVSSLVCAHLFLRPLLARLQDRQYRPRIEQAVLEGSLPANGGRQHYMRAAARRDDGLWRVRAFEDQDSSLTRVMAGANALLIRTIGAPSVNDGENVMIDLWR